MTALQQVKLWFAEYPAIKDYLEPNEIETLTAAVGAKTLTDVGDCLGGGAPQTTPRNRTGISKAAAGARLTKLENKMKSIIPSLDVESDASRIKSGQTLTKNIAEQISTLYFKVVVKGRTDRLPEYNTWDDNRSFKRALGNALKGKTGGAEPLLVFTTYYGIVCAFIFAWKLTLMDGSTAVLVPYIVSAATGDDGLPADAIMRSLINKFLSLLPSDANIVMELSSDKKKALHKMMRFRSCTDASIDQQIELSELGWVDVDYKWLQPSGKGKLEDFTLVVNCRPEDVYLDKERATRTYEAIHAAYVAELDGVKGELRAKFDRNMERLRHQLVDTEPRLYPREQMRAKLKKSEDPQKPVSRGRLC